MGIDNEETDSEDRLYFVRKHGIPIPVFGAFLRVFAKKYRGKFQKTRGETEKFREATSSDSDFYPSDPEGTAFDFQLDTTPMVFPTEKKPVDPDADDMA